MWKNYLMTAGWITAFAFSTMGQVDGDFDLTFGNGGYSVLSVNSLETFQHVVVQDDQKIVAVGMSWNASFIASAYAVRYTTSGALDMTFGNNGVFVQTLNFEADIYSCVINSQGKIIMAGATTDYNNYKLLLIQLNANGTLDTSFGTNGIVQQQVSTAPGYFEDFAYDVTLDADENILVAGTSYNDNSIVVPVVVRFTPSGVLDTSFGANGVATIPAGAGSSEFQCIQVQPDGKILAAGSFGNSLFWYVFLMVRFNEDGSLDTTFGEDGIIKFNYGNVDDEGYDMALTPDGKIVVAGYTATAGYNFSTLLMQFTPDGVLDPSFGIGGTVEEDLDNYDVAEGVLIQEDGKIIMAGTSGMGPPNSFDMAVWKYNADGSPDVTFGTNGLSSPTLSGFYVMGHEVAIQADGKLVIPGQVRTPNNVNHFFISRLHNSLLGDVYNATFTVTDNSTGLPIENAAVFMNNTTLYTDLNGEVVFTNLADGNYSYNVTLPCYSEGFGSIDISGSDAYESVAIDPATTNNVFFFIGSPLAILGATVTLTDGAEFYESFVTTDTFGGEMIGDVPFGEYTYTIETPCYETVSGSVVVDCYGGGGVGIFEEPTEFSTNNVFFFVGSPLALLGATITLTDGADFNTSFVTSDPFGGEMIADVPFGEYTYTISTPCYETVSGTITVDCNGEEGIGIFEEPAELTSNNVFFFIGSPLAILGATVTLTDGADFNASFVTTDTFGGEMIGDVPYGEYTYTISTPCYETVTGSITVDCNDGEGIAIMEEPAEIVIDNEVTLADNILTATASGYEYQWVDCNNENEPLEGETGQSLTVTETGNYAVIISTENCSVMSDCNTVTITGISTTNYSNGILVFPNPCADQLRIQSMELIAGSLIEMISVTGQVVHRQVPGANGTVEMDVSSLSAGAYLLRISNSDRTLSTRILKQ